MMRPSQIMLFNFLSSLNLTVFATRNQSKFDSFYTLVLLLHAFLNNSLWCKQLRLIDVIFAHITFFVNVKAPFKQSDRLSGQHTTTCSWALNWAYNKFSFPNKSTGCRVSGRQDFAPKRPSSSQNNCNYFMALSRRRQVVPTTDNLSNSLKREPTSCRAKWLSDNLNGA